MTNRSDRGSNKPRGAERFERVDLIRDSICGLHQGQQPCGAARTGRTHGCTRPVLIAAQKPLAPRGPSTHGRQFAAWLGLTPRPHSSGGKERLGGISKQGDGYLRKLLVVGATAVMRMARKDPSRQPWLAQLLGRKPVKIATVGLANKTARIAWAVMSRKEVYAASAA